MPDLSLRVLPAWTAVAAAMALAVPCAAQRPATDGTRPVAVAARRLERGETLADGDITWRAARAGDRAVDTSAVGRVGWVARRVLRAGERLIAPAVQAPPAVRSGQAVQLSYSRGDIRLTMAGVAMSSAAIGEEVLVRLDATHRLRAVVTAPGCVRAREPRSRH